MYSPYQSYTSAPSVNKPQVGPALLPCTHCGASANSLEIAPWEGKPFVWCTCGWAWPLQHGVSQHQQQQQQQQAPQSAWACSPMAAPMTTMWAPDTYEGASTNSAPSSNHSDCEEESPEDVAAAEKALEEFLAKSNLSQLYQPLCAARLMMSTLRKIPLCNMHEAILSVVPEPGPRQRLIDAVTSTPALSSMSHKAKQGMWDLAKSEGRTVYLRGMSSMTDTELRDYLQSHHGVVEDMRYMFHPRNNLFMGYGFVMFQKKEVVDAILATPTLNVMPGVVITVKCSDNLARE